MKILFLLSITLIGLPAIHAQTTVAKNNLAPESQETAKLSTEVVRLFQAGKYDEAAPIAKQAITAREKALGPNHLLVAQAWRNLAYIELKLKNPKESSKAFDKAFDIYEKNQPLSTADEKMFTEMLEAVAIYDAIDGQIDKAEKRLIRAVGMRERLNGMDAGETSATLLSLAHIYEAKGEYEKAGPLLRRSLSIRTKDSNKLSDDATEIYDSLYCTLIKLNQPVEAQQLEDRYDPQPNKDKVKEISAGVLNGKALSLPKPAYPAAARAAGAEGKVDVDVRINESGKVIFACAVTGAKELQRPSEISAYQSKFSPTTLDGKPVRVKGTITYKYIR